MKLRSIRVREVGRFRDSVELTGLQPGLNLLVGENEAGKSTLFRALNTVFTESYSTSKADVKNGLRPYGGGAPRIEVEFEIGNDHYRLTKQYLAAKEAELVRLPGGAVVARGGEVDDALATLLAGSGEAAGAGGALRSRLNLLWLDATHELAAKQPAGAENDLIKSLVGKSAETIASSASATAIRKEIAAQLAVNLTPAAIKAGKITAKKNAPLHDAVQTYQAAEARVAQLREEVDRLSERRQHYADLITARDGMADDASLVAASTAAAHALAEAHLTQTRRKTLQSDLDTVAVKLEQARERHARMEAAGAEAIKLSADRNAAQSALSDATTTRDDIDGQMKDSRQRLDALDADMVAVRGVQQRHALVDKQNAAVKLATTLEELDQLNIQIDALQSDIEHCAVTEELIERLRSVSQDIRSREAARDGESTIVTVTYDDPSDQTVQRDGDPVAHDVPVALDGAAEFQVPGATLRVDPGALSSQQSLQEELTDLVAERDELLSTIRCASLKDAEAAWKAHVKRVQDHALCVQRHDALAPDGRDAIADRLALMRASASELEKSAAPASEACPWADADRPELEEVSADLASRKADEIDQHEALQVKAQAAHAAHATAAATLEQLSKSAPPAPSSAADLAALAETVAALTAEHQKRAAALVEIEAQAGDAAAFARLEEAAKLADQALESGRAKRVSISNEIAKLDGVLEAEHGRGQDEDLRAAEAELADAKASGARIRQSIEELFCLDETLQAVEAERHAHLVAPLRDRMQPYVEQLFGTASLSFGDDYAIEALARSDEAPTEALGNLSTGTREQIAIIARLAYAKLMVDGGVETPLILDDAMVFSDDVRIGQMFSVLQKAAEHHQIIILTCRAQSFANLPAHRISLGLPSQVAAAE